MPSIQDMNISTMELPQVGLAATIQQNNNTQVINLENKVQDKVSLLASKRDRLLGLNDADTPVLETTGTLRETPTTGARYDAVELQHGSNPYDMYGTDNKAAGEYGKSTRAMGAQRAEVARILGKPEGSLTPQDMVDVGNQQQVQKLADLVRSPGEARWEAPLIRGAEQTNLTGKYVDEYGNKVQIPLDVEVGVQQAGRKDLSGQRDLGSLVNVQTGMNVTDAAALDPRQNAFAGSMQSASQPQQATYTKEQLDKAFGADRPDYNVARGVGSATLNVGAKVGSLVGEGVESAGEFFGSKGVTGAGAEAQKAFTDMQRTGFADKITGYDSTDVQELHKEISDTINRDGYLMAFGKAVTDPRSLEVLITSAPEMIALAASVGGMAVANANNNINIGQSELGREFTPEEKAMSAVTSIASTYLDRWGDKLALSGMNPTKQALKEAVEKAPDGVKDVLASKFGGGILKIGEAPLKLAGAAAIEGSTEYAQTLGEAAAQRPEVFENGFTEKEMQDAGVAGVLGAAMGTQMAVPSVASGVVFGDKEMVVPQESPVDVKVNTEDKPEVGSKAKAVDEFWAKMKQAKADTNDEVSMRNREEVRNVATNFVKGNDTLGILASDADTKEKLDKVKELLTFVAEDSQLDEETKKVLTGRLSEQLGVDQGRVAGVVEEAEKVGTAIKDLKTVDDVDNEVTTGPRGFLTYYNSAVEAMRDGDQKAVEENTRKLEKFIGVQELKQARFEAAQKEVLREYADRVEMLKKSTGMSDIEARKEVYSQWAKERNKGTGTVDVPYSDERVNPFKLFKSQVIENEVAKGRGQEYDFGGYKVVAGINKSIEAMNMLYKQLVGDTAVSEGLPKVTKDWIDKKLETSTPEKVVEAVNRDAKLTAKQKEAVVAYVKEKQPVSVNEVDFSKELTKEQVDAGAKEVAGKIKAGAKEFTESELQFRENYRDEVEKELVVEETPEVAFEEPLDVNMDVEPDIDFEETETDYVSPEEVNQVFEEATMPGERTVGETKEGIKANKEVELVLRRAKEVAETKKELAKAKIEGRTEEVKKSAAKLDTVKKWSEMMAVQSPVSKQLANVRKLYFGDAKAVRVSNTLKVKDVTPLNVTEVVAEKEMLDVIEAAIAPVEMTKSGRVNQNESEGDPARALLFNDNGSMNGTVVTALWKTMNDYLATSASGLTAPMTSEKLEEMFPFVQKLDESNPEDLDLMLDLLEQMKNGGELLKLEVEGIGNDVMKLLGLSAADNKVPERDIQGFKTSFGMMAVNMAVARGDLKVTKIEARGSGTIPVLQVGEKLFDRMDEVLDERDKYSTYDSPDAPRKSYSFEPIYRDEVEVHNQPFTDVTPLQKEMKQTLDDLKFVPNSGMNVLLELYEDKEELKDVLGRKNQAELDKMSYDGKKAAESVNREIEVKVDAFYQMQEDAKLGDGYRPMWFEWFVTKGGRTNSFATVVDPQSDKQLARWLVTTEGSRVDVEASDLKENTQVGLGFKYGLVQAFDGALPEKVEVDKNSKEKVIAMADRLLAMSDEELKAMVKDSEHVGHAMLALANVRKAREGDFESDLVMEMDGLTNGLAFRLVQFAMDDTMELLPKVGVVRESDPMWETGTIAEVKDGKYGEFLDLYETVGANLAGAKIELSKENVKIQEALKEVLPDLKDRKTARKIAKSPVMVTGYSAGETSTKLAIVNEQISSLVEQIVEGKIGKEALGVILDGTGIKASEIVALLKSKSIRDPKLAKVRAKLTGFYMQAYAEPMYEALVNTIGSLKDVGTTVTTAYAYMYEVLMNAYKDKLKDKVSKLEKKRTLSSEEKIELMREILEEVGPIVRNSETVGKLDRVLALSKELVDIADDAEKAGIAGTYATSVNAKGKNGIDTVKMVMRGFGEPGAAGGVLQTHTEDNHAMARTMMESKNKFNQVFDAMVLGVGQWDDVNGYNKSFYELNKEFSMMDAVIEAVERNAGSKYAEGVTVKVGKEQVTGNDLLEVLDGYKQEIDRNRATIFGENVKIGQMVGVNGTMYEVDVKKESARIEDMKKEVRSALQEFANAAEGLLKDKLVGIVKKMGCN